MRSVRSPKAIAGLFQHPARVALAVRWVCWVRGARRGAALKGVGGRLLPNCDPVVPGQFADDPLPAESANAAILFSAKRPRGHAGWVEGRWSCGGRGAAVQGGKDDDDAHARVAAGPASPPL